MVTAVGIHVIWLKGLCSYFKVFWRVTITVYFFRSRLVYHGSGCLYVQRCFGKTVKSYPVEPTTHLQKSSLPLGVSNNDVGKVTHHLHSSHCYAISPSLQIFLQPWDHETTCLRRGYQIRIHIESIEYGVWLPEPKWSGLHYSLGYKMSLWQTVAQRTLFQAKI